MEKIIGKRLLLLLFFFFAYFLIEKYAVPKFLNYKQDIEMMYISIFALFIKHSMEKIFIFLHELQINSKYEAKLINEQIKLMSNTFNYFSLAIGYAAIINPILNGKLYEFRHLFLFALFLYFHYLAQKILSFYKNEEV